MSRPSAPPSPHMVLSTDSGPACFCSGDDGFRHARRQVQVPLHSLTAATPQPSGAGGSDTLLQSGHSGVSIGGVTPRLTCSRHLVSSF